MRLCPDCQENILIADNLSPVRDLSLLSAVDRPIRVILCGVGQVIHPDYLNIARTTGGSIHLMEEDLYDLVRLNEGEEVELGGVTYKIINDRFVITKGI
ncbi:MAG: hypothetical protein AAGJ82_02600 [Bacteroidota bacterium]